VYETACLRCELIRIAQWSFDRRTPTFEFLRRQADIAEVFIRDLSVFLVEKRDFDFNYLLRTELAILDDINS